MSNSLKHLQHIFPGGANFFSEFDPSPYLRACAAVSGVYPWVVRISRS